MTLTEARDQVRYGARNAGDSGTYEDFVIDFAIKAVCERFCRVTQCLKAANNVALASGNAAVDASAITGFRPERLTAAYVVGVAAPLELFDWSELYRRSIECPSTGTPRAIAWETPTVGKVWPTPDAAYTLRLRWVQPFTTWTAGAVGDGITLNLPDDYLASILPFGPPAILQHNEPEHAYASESYKKYLAFEASMVGAGNLAVRTAPRDRWR